MSDSLTVAGFVALVTLLLVMGGFVARLVSANNGLRERMARLEQSVEDHLKNGKRHAE